MTFKNSTISTEKADGIARIVRELGFLRNIVGPAEAGFALLSVFIERPDQYTKRQLADGTEVPSMIYHDDIVDAGLVVVLSPETGRVADARVILGDSTLLTESAVEEANRRIAELIR